MNKELEKVNKILKKEFGKSRKMYLATSNKHVPKVNIVTTYFCHDSFYMVTHESSELLKSIRKNKYVSLCTAASFHKFQGESIDIGHPFKKDNKALNDVLIKKMGDWYVNNHNVADSSMCLVKIKLIKAFTYANKVGYRIDFNSRVVDSFSYAPHG